MRSLFQLQKAMRRLSSIFHLLPALLETCEYAMWEVRKNSKQHQRKRIKKEALTFLWKKRPISAADCEWKSSLPNLLPEILTPLLYF